uniref:TRAF-type domain-containing protein n=1 Tax=Chromera velia CCMP2878 TaxID=1169474 RepID=A0A0G4H5A1_9ALVE|eukprot:Cvel_24705.t1-p1 / transcript=Cvel_24705.t1 / gene=Cvel_24705 / organism=Chromera_velia_CCMP2878 / gene_product=RING finger protein 151, putative / transcript_product=RING finger protein 151, putative / location=Cvel_scaffold2710:2283-4724(-) / protein_length=429 / sequence_SO=supercontig / SO=protein_coding / is_pseudo=false
MFCNDCIQPVLKAKKPCPCCRGPFKSIKNPPVALRNAVQKVEWSCKYKDDGCEFTGTTQAVQKHQEDCPEVRVTCHVPNCNESIKRSALEAHLDDRKQKTKHKKLEKDEFAKLWAEPDKDSFTIVLCFPNFNKEIRKMNKDEYVSFQGFPFQGERFLVDLLPKGDAKSDKGNASLALMIGETACNDIKVSVSVGVVNGKTEVCRVVDLSEEENYTYRWLNFCSTKELQSAARATENGTLKLRLRLSASCKAVEPISPESIGKREDSLGLRLSLRAFPSRVADLEKGETLKTEEFTFQKTTFHLEILPDGAWVSLQLHQNLQSPPFEKPIYLGATVGGMKERSGSQTIQEFVDSKMISVQFCKTDELLAHAEARGGEVELFISLNAQAEAKWVGLELDEEEDLEEDEEDAEEEEDEEEAREEEDEEEDDE